MVNKQYNIHNTSVKNKSKSASPADDSDYTPSAFERNITQHYYQDNSDAFSDLLDDNCGDHKAATLSVQSVQPEQRSIFNVIATTDDHLITTTSVTTNTSLDSDSQKPLSINDIGRFQYILQMDREMVSACYVFFLLLLWTLIAGRRRSSESECASFGSDAYLFVSINRFVRLLFMCFPFRFKLNVSIVFVRCISN